MADIKTVIIAEIKSNDKFHNIKDNTGVEYGISREKSPVLSAQLNTAKVGDEVKAEYFLWKDKHYLSDIKESGKSGGKGYAPKDKSFEAALASLEAASKLFSLTKDVTSEKVLQYADAFHAWTMSKSTK